jgi:hypothetical protein
LPDGRALTEASNSETEIVETGGAICAKKILFNNQAVVDGWNRGEESGDLNRRKNMSGEGAKRLGEKLLMEVEVEDLSSVCLINTTYQKYGTC